MQLSLNPLRVRAILMSREYKALFFGENGEIKMSGHRVLADLRDFTHLTAATIFSSDALEMARREGRREVGVRIMNYLNLDEEAVQKLMELDDGLG